MRALKQALAQSGLLVALVRGRPGGSDVVLEATVQTARGAFSDVSVYELSVAPEVRVQPLCDGCGLGAVCLGCERSVVSSCR